MGVLSHSLYRPLGPGNRLDQRGPVRHGAEQVDLTQGGSGPLLVGGGEDLHFLAGHGRRRGLAAATVITRVYEHTFE